MSEDLSDINGITAPTTEEGVLAEPEEDPFSPHNLAISQFILTARIYDVLMTSLLQVNPSAAKDLLELHMNGSLMGPAPAFNGQFITNLANEDEEE